MTSPVIANGSVYVAKMDAHTLYAFDEESGKERWTFTAGARIDSPPSVHRGKVVFGGAEDPAAPCRERDLQLTVKTCVRC